MKGVTGGWDMNYKKISVLLIILPILLISIPGCGSSQEPQSPSAPPLENVPARPPEDQPQVFTVSSAPSSEIKVELSIAGSPLLDQPV
jgi:hypothetical protein